MSERLGSLSVRIGAWFEASATGWGIAAIPVLFGLLLLALALNWL